MKVSMLFTPITSPENIITIKSTKDHLFTKFLATKLIIVHYWVNCLLLSRKNQSDMPLENAPHSCVYCYKQVGRPYLLITNVSKSLTITQNTLQFSTSEDCVICTRAISALAQDRFQWILEDRGLTTSGM